MPGGEEEDGGGSRTRRATAAASAAARAAACDDGAADAALFPAAGLSSIYRVSRQLDREGRTRRACRTLPPPPCRAAAPCQPAPRPLCH